MENNAANKSLFFAQYYGQRVLLIRDKEEPMLYVGFDDMQNNNVRDTDYLLLKSIDNMPEEHKQYNDNDMLRKLGYAVEFLGTDIHTMISYGWIKIDNNNTL